MSVKHDHESLDRYCKTLAMEAAVGNRTKTLVKRHFEGERTCGLVLWLRDIRYKLAKKTTESPNH